MFDFCFYFNIKHKINVRTLRNMARIDRQRLAFLPVSKARANKLYISDNVRILYIHHNRDINAKKKKKGKKRHWLLKILTGNFDSTFYHKFFTNSRTHFYFHFTHLSTSTVMTFWLCKRTIKETTRLWWRTQSVDTASTKIGECHGESPVCFVKCIHSCTETNRKREIFTLSRDRNATILCRLHFYAISVLHVEWVSEWLLLSAIFQLYHGENKLIFNVIMRRSAFY